MKRSNRLILLIGIVLAVVAFIGIVLTFQGPLGGAAQEPAELPAVYATAAIPLGTTIKAEQLEVRRIPADQRALDAFEDTGLVVGKIAATNIAAGQQLREADFAFNAGTQAISGNIPRGLRAIAIQVDQVSGVGTLINVGDHVDVISTFDNKTFLAPGPRAQLPADIAPTLATLPEALSVSSVKVLLQDLLVVGTLLPPPPTAQDGTATTTGPTLGANQEELVIVAVTPQQAEVIRFAQAQGEVTLTLRSPKDYVDEAGEPVVPTAQTTTGIVLKNVLDEYGVLVPELQSVAPVTIR